MNTKNLASTFVKLVFLLALALGINYALATVGFVGPTGSFPTCPSTTPGCNTPINVSTTDQVKSAGLAVNAFLASANAEFKQDVTVDQLAGTRQQVTCSDTSGKLINCDSGLQGTLTPVTSGYCGAGITVASGSLKYYQVGDAVHVYGYIGLNVNSSKPTICAQINGLPKPFPTSGSPVLGGAPASFLYYQSSSWHDLSGLLNYNSSSALTFSTYDDRAFIDTGTIPSTGEWIAYVDFTY